MKYSVCVVYFSAEEKEKRCCYLCVSSGKFSLVQSHLTYQLVPNDVVDVSKLLTCCETPNFTKSSKEIHEHGATRGDIF